MLQSLNKSALTRVPVPQLFFMGLTEAFSCRPSVYNLTGSCEGSWHCFHPDINSEIIKLSRFNFISSLVCKLNVLLGSRTNDPVLPRWFCLLRRDVGIAAAAPKNSFTLFHYQSRFTASDFTAVFFLSGLYCVLKRFLLGLSPVIAALQEGTAGWINIWKRVSVGLNRKETMKHLDQKLTSSRL